MTFVSLTPTPLLKGLSKEIRQDAFKIPLNHSVELAAK